MKTMNIKLLSCFLVGTLSTGPVLAQLDWNLGGNLVSLGTDYLGCNAQVHPRFTCAPSRASRSTSV